MENKYLKCLAGKIECNLWDSEHHYCLIHNGSFDIDWEQCPWPSRQKPIDRRGYVFNLTEKEMRELSTETMNELRKLKPIRELPKTDCSTCTCIDHADSFAKGRAEGVRECIEAVEKSICNIGCDACANNCLQIISVTDLKAAIAALEGVKGKL